MGKDIKKVITRGALMVGVFSVLLVLFTFIYPT